MSYPLARIDELTAQLATVTAERDEARAFNWNSVLADDLRSRVAELKAENSRLRAREHVVTDTGDCADWCIACRDERTERAENVRLRTQLIAVTAERDQFKGWLDDANVRNMKDQDEASAEAVKLTKERDEAWEKKRRALSDMAEMHAENARLRAAIAPTAENVEAIILTMMCKPSVSCEENARATLAAIAARAGVKL